jgi:hypothetical protein
LDTTGEIKGGVVRSAGVREGSIKLRNANDKSRHLALTIGDFVFLYDTMALKGDFHPVLAKHSASMNLIDLVIIGVD